MYAARIDYLLTQAELTDEAAALYDGGWRDGDLEELVAEYGMSEDHASDLCEIFKEYDRRAEGGGED